MAKRIFDLTAADCARLSRQELLNAIVLSEGRTLVAETVVSHPPLLGKVSNAELAAAVGADVILLNLYDVQSPVVLGMPSGAGVTPGDVKRLVGRPVGVNLEPVAPDSTVVPPGRRATVENFRMAADQGVDLIVITGNPGTGVTVPGIVAAVKAAHETVGDRVIIVAGKMHAAGVAAEGGTAILTDAQIADLAAAGADVILAPAPGTVPGVTVEVAAGWVRAAHREAKLALLAIGTSQEGSSLETITRIAEMTKQAGADICHIGDGCYGGMAPPENIMAYSVAIRGRAHTYRRIALGFRRESE